MLIRHLAIKLLAPLVLVSLLLVGACLAGALYLNRLHVNISDVIHEHVESTLAAVNLETTVRKMVRRLRDDHRNPELLTSRLEEHYQNALEDLAGARRLANLEREQVLVREIAAGLDAYHAGWESRQRSPVPDWPARDADLARILEERVLAGCRELRDFNTFNVGESDQFNYRVIHQVTWWLLAVGLGAPLSGLALGYAMARSLHQSICQLSVRIRDAAGRLSGQRYSVTLEDPADLHDLHRQMQTVIEEIEHTVERLQQREREVLRAEQLAAVGQVAAGVAHELRNPLTSVKMLVQTGLEGPRPAGLAAEDLGIIEHEILRMEGCIQTFLDFARPPSCERRLTDLLTVVRRALTLVEGRARRQKVQVTTDLPPGPVKLQLDGEQIQQVLLNLLLNALDALPHGGEVRVTVEAPDEAGRPARVLVRDTGPGIAPRIRARLFEPFVSSKETGLGLGLSICLRLIEAHGGTITGENPAEGGARFSFTLPGGGKQTRRQGDKETRRIPPRSA